MDEENKFIDNVVVIKATLISVILSFLLVDTLFV